MLFIEKDILSRENSCGNYFFFAICQKMKFGSTLAAQCHLIFINKSQHLAYGDINKRVAIILESEFDAILIQQFAADLCFCIATGGSTQPLDLYTDYLIRKALLFLICPDVDAAGAKFIRKIKGNYKQSKLWPELP
ncbi:toprim domain-containing protein [Neochlamydia sp. EPS4]|uniref:toprim domain-containing protein n=1 Tax=Neochlamydia sp. EPS4 TaxID=1478175 RepID=UPI0005D10575|nr:toprim domain-containing protein [Neochlamydia sp. EPS4]